MSGLLADLRKLGSRPGILVTVVAADGSTPRGTGTTMIVDSDGTIVSGTIGGGALEHRVVARTRQMLSADGAAEQDEFPLGPELGQCCGGRVSLLFERLPLSITPDDQDIAFVTTLEPVVNRRMAGRGQLEALGCLSSVDQGRSVVVRDSAGRQILVQPAFQPRQPLAIFGAGHVGGAVVRAIAPLPFRVTWIDDRADQFPVDRDPAVTYILAPRPETEVRGLQPGAFVLIMSHSHGLDYRICRQALLRDDLDYVGLIGSQTKLARFRKWAQAYDLGPEAVARLVCPIGLPGIHGKDPAIIAASVAADLLARCERIQQDRTSTSALRVAS